jgi:hypothetical protein
MIGATALSKGRGTFWDEIGPIRKHGQFDVKLSATKELTVSSHL